MSQALSGLPESLVRDTAGLDLTSVLQTLAARFPGAVTFSTSFSNEDQIIAHLIAKSGAAVSVFTLDTGRLFGATHEVWHSTAIATGLTIRAYYPDADALQNYAEINGTNAFYSSPELRKECCRIRKVEPLKRALRGQVVWITGLRAEHSPNRKSLPQFEWDEANDIIKYHPLLHWTTDEVTAYVKTHRLPYNALYDRGFASIGCEPCTRAIRPGEDIRAGRWWWEDASKKECGLHTHAVAPIHQTSTASN